MDTDQKFYFMEMNTRLQVKYLHYLPVMCLTQQFETLLIFESTSFSCGLKEYSLFLFVKNLMKISLEVFVPEPEAY